MYQCHDDDTAQVKSIWNVWTRAVRQAGLVGSGSGLHTKVLRNVGHFCRQLLLKQSSWLNLQWKII